MSKLKFGLQHPCFTYDGKGHAIFETVKERAQYAEEHGFDSFFVMDHFLQIPYVGAIDETMIRVEFHDLFDPIHVKELVHQCRLYLARNSQIVQNVTG